MALGNNREVAARRPFLLRVPLSDSHNLWRSPEPGLPHRADEPPFGRASPIVDPNANDR